MEKPERGAPRMAGPHDAMARKRALALMRARDDGDADALSGLLPRAVGAGKSSADAVMAAVRGRGGPVRLDAPVPGRFRRFRPLPAAVAVLVAALVSSVVTSAVIEARSTVLVRFVLSEPDAASVTLAADFNGWSSEAMPLRRTADGDWEIVVPLRKGRAYQYNFVIDGDVWVVDPSAPIRLEDGFGGAVSSMAL
ncbi:isoamylase early set domain-containing protein [Zavarzinia sp.]|uniref:isoamylase early set domain-containing protein n=1 Tax=Zavarzinia sp. TaxID=2027920 RepID=UPI00356B231C